MKNLTTIFNKNTRVPVCAACAFLSMLVIDLAASSPEPGALRLTFAPRYPVLFIFLLWAYYKALPLTVSRPRAVGAGALVYAVLIALGLNVGVSSSLLPGLVGKLSMVGYPAYVLGLFITAYFALKLVVYYFENEQKKEMSVNKAPSFFTDNALSLFTCAGVLFLAWLVYFVAFWPAMTSFDSYSEIMWAWGVGVAPLSDAHPIMHTLLLWAFLNLGKALGGTVGAGIAYYSAFQMAFLALTLSYALRLMARFDVRIGIRVAMLALFALLPFYGAFSVSLGKDTLLAAGTALYSLLMYSAIQNPRAFFSKKLTLAGFCAASFFLCVIKNPGFFIFILSFPFLFLALKKYFKQLIIILAVVFACYFGIRGTLIKALNVSAHAGATAVVPVQQIANILTNHAGELTPEQNAALSKYFIDPKRLPECYTPWLADHTTWLLNKTNYNADKKGFNELWLSLAKAYPLDALNATALNSSGYFYVPSIRPILNPFSYYDLIETAENEWLGFLSAGADPTYTPDMVKTALPQFKQWARYLLYTPQLRWVPVLGVLFSIGAYFFAMVFLALYALTQRRYKLLVPLLPLFVAWLVCIASPVNTEFRYALPFVIGTTCLFPLFTCSRAPRPQPRETQTKPGA